MLCRDGKDKEICTCACYKGQRQVFFGYWQGPKSYLGGEKAERHEEGSEEREAEEHGQEDQQGEGEGSESKAQGAGKEERAC